MDTSAIVEKARECGSVRLACDLLGVDLSECEKNRRAFQDFDRDLTIALAEHEAETLALLREKKPDWYAERMWPERYNLSRMKDDEPQDGSPDTWIKLMQAAAE